MSNIKPVPEGYHTLTPYLTIKDAAQAIEFYKKAFGAKELYRLSDPGGRIGHAELQIGDSRLMLSDEFPEMEGRGPRTLGGTPVMLHLYVEDSDELVRRAASAGARVLSPVEDQFYGDRGGKVQDPYGHIWYISTHKEDLSAEEIDRRAREKFGFKHVQAA
ncbi:MAG TPA: VOC family protein [Elusimicrobiota bacterium]|nr:VOC family protein [Elusimicrobiota bacterium]